MSGIHKMHQHDLEKTLLEDQAQATLAEAQLAIVTAKYVTLSSDKNAICRTKFSSFLSVLSEDIVGGAWLTDIRITDSGKNMIFKGIAISSASVQRFVNNLKLNPLFSKNTINLQDMSQLSDNKAGTLQFTIVGATPHE
jgi:Tfp pilus assembly protein PilN